MFGSVLNTPLDIASVDWIVLIEGGKNQKNKSVTKSFV